MAPNKKQTNEKKNVGCPPSADVPLAAHTSSSYSPPPPPSLADASSPPQAISPPPETASKISEHSFVIQYSEGDLTWHFNCTDLDAPASTAVADAMALGLDKVCASVEISREQLMAFTSFPTSIGGRQFSVKEWLSWGKQPYVTLCSKPNAGLLQQRDDAREKLRQACIAKEKLITDGLSSLGIANECGGCSELRASMASLEASMASQFADSRRMQEVSVLNTASLEKENERLSAAITGLENGKKDMEKVVAAVIDKLEALNRRTGQILRRIVVQDARKEAVKRFGGKSQSISNYHDYFSAREQEALALGISSKLLDLLKDGTWGLNKAAQVAPTADKAHAVMELDGAHRAAFVEAFEFAYQEKVDTYLVNMIELESKD